MDDEGECSTEGSEDEDESSTSSTSSEEQEAPANSWDKGRMRQALLLHINDTLTNRHNNLSAIYKHVTLTRQGKLHFVHHQLTSNIGGGSATGTGAPPLTDLRCYLEAKSFLPVQTSRLIKFYCILEQIFWPFSQLLLNWAKINGVTEHPGSSGDMAGTGASDSDGLKQDHLLLLAIFFLVRRHIIPSFKLLQKWSTSRLHQLNVDGLDTGFCENVGIVRGKCLEVGIGSLGPEEWTLERILQLQCEFFLEMSTFNYAHQGISPGSGTSFSKFGQGQLLVLNPTNSRRMDTNSMLCLQDILDPCQNVTKKVNENWILRFQSACKQTADKIFPLIWSGDLLNATLILMDAGSAVESGSKNQKFQKPEDEWENPDPVTIAAGWPVQRVICFKVPPTFLEMLNQCCVIAAGDEGGGDGGVPRPVDLAAIYPVVVKNLFQKFVEEFNELFWRKLVAAHMVQSNGNPITFEFVKGFQCSTTAMKEEKARFVVKALLEVFFQMSGDTSSIARFFVKDDWTKETRDEILMLDVDKVYASKLVKSFLKGVNPPKVAYGQRIGQPRRPPIMAAIELDARFEENGGISLYTFAKYNENQDAIEEVRLRQYLDWYEVLMKTFVIKKFVKWMGAHVMRDLDEDVDMSMNPTPENKPKMGGNSSGIATVYPQPPPHHQLDFWMGSGQLIGSPYQDFSGSVASGHPAPPPGRLVKVSQGIGGMRGGRGGGRGGRGRGSGTAGAGGRGRGGGRVLFGKRGSGHKAPFFK